jgi:ubiquinone/menaquinone biosynthesis C-methylase UbiE
LCAPAIPKATSALDGAGPRILDLGAGAAPWTLALAAVNPRVRITAVEVADVLPVTRQAVVAAGRAAQFELVEHDMFTLNVDEDAFDLVILGNVCHLFDDDTNRRLLRRVAGWLAPGGTVAIIDFLPNERRDGPRALALYSVELAQRKPAGQLYPFSSYAGWLRETGFERIERVELTACPPVALVRARRP